MSVKIAQRRSVWNTLKENTNLLGGVEEFIKPSFREDMNVLREQDSLARPVARQAKENLKKADSYLRSKEYILCAVELENFYNTLDEMFGHLNKIIDISDKKYNEMLTENLDDSHFETLTNRKRAETSGEVIKKEALLDWVTNMFSGRRRGISLLERNYGHFKELSAGMRLHLRNALSLNEFIKAKFSVMAAARAERNIQAYVRAAKVMLQAKTEKKKAYDVFFDKNVQPFVDMLKQKKALQDAESAKRETQDAIEKEEAIRAEERETSTHSTESAPSSTTVESKSTSTTPASSEPKATRKPAKLEVPLQDEEFEEVSPGEYSTTSPDAAMTKTVSTPSTSSAPSTPIAPAAPEAPESSVADVEPSIHPMPPQLSTPVVHDGELMDEVAAAPAAEEEMVGEVVPAPAALPAAKPPVPAQHAKARPSVAKKAPAPKAPSTKKGPTTRKPTEKTQKVSADHSEFLSKIANITDEKLLAREILAYSEAIEELDEEMSLKLLSVAEGLITG